MNNGEFRTIREALRSSERRCRALLENAKLERKRAREAVWRLNQMREEEARRIAHALHDETSQLLSAVHLALAELARKLPAHTRQNLREISRLLDGAEEHLRRLSHELRPTILDDLGLMPALRQLIDGVSIRSGLKITLVDATSGRLPGPIETALYRSVQEALTNVTKHASASLVEVGLFQENGKIRLTISDDGAGFDMRESRAQRGNGGLGLIGIRERLYPLRGSLKINSSPGNGTQLTLLIRVRAPEVFAIPSPRESGTSLNLKRWPAELHSDAKGFD